MSKKELTSNRQSLEIHERNIRLEAMEEAAKKKFGKFNHQL